MVFIYNCAPTKVKGKHEPYMLFVRLVVGIKGTSVEYVHIQLFGCVHLQTQ